MGHHGHCRLAKLFSGDYLYRVAQPRRIDFEFELREDMGAACALTFYNYSLLRSRQLARRCGGPQRSEKRLTSLCVAPQIR